MTTHDGMRSEVIKKLKFGQVLRIHSNDARVDKVLKVTVAAFYPDFVLCHGAGYRYCFSYYELWTRLQHKQGKVTIPDYIKG